MTQTIDQLMDQRRPIPDDMTPDDLRAEIDRLNRIIVRALERAKHDPTFQRWGTGWAMQSDLKEAFIRRTEGDGYPDGY